MIFYVENPKDPTKTIGTNKPIQKKIRIQTQINSQKLVTSLYTNNDQSENEVKKTIPFTIASKRIKYLE